MLAKKYQQQKVLLKLCRIHACCMMDERRLTNIGGIWLICKENLEGIGCKVTRTLYEEISKSFYNIFTLFTLYYGYKKKTQSKFLTKGAGKLWKP